MNKHTNGRFIVHWTTNSAQKKAFIFTDIEPQTLEREENGKARRISTLCLNLEPPKYGTSEVS